MKKLSTIESRTLFDQLCVTGSYQATADIYGLSKTWIRNLALAHFGSEVMRSIIKKHHGKYTDCVICKQTFGGAVIHGGRSLCRKCYMLVYNQTNRRSISYMNPYRPISDTEFVEAAEKVIEMRLADAR